MNWRRVFDIERIKVVSKFSPFAKGEAERDFKKSTPNPPLLKEGARFSALILFTKYEKEHRRK